MKKIQHLLHSLSLRVPNAYSLRSSGIRFYTWNKQHNSMFWSIFTGMEYNNFIPKIQKLKPKPDLIIDAGASIGVFSLLLSHYMRIGMLDWDNPEFMAIEPSSYNIQYLKKNINRNRLNIQIYNNLVGKCEGAEQFAVSSKHPWSQSKFRHLSNHLIQVHYLDLSPILESKENVVIKMDVEGSEFDWIESTEESLLNKIMVFIVEWHHEHGDYESAKRKLESAGLQLAKTGLNEGNRRVDCFIRSD